MKEISSFPHNMTASAPVLYGDLVFSGTSNGRDEDGNLPFPDTAAIIALDRKTGELVWSDNSPGSDVLHGQWASPAVATIGGVGQVVMGQGDGWVRAYVAQTGKKLWEFDTNPKEAVWPEDRNNVISTPVIDSDRVYIANGQDPEHGTGVGHFYCIDGTQRGDVTERARIWHYGEIGRSISTAVVYEGLVYIPDFAGFLHCLDAETGKAQWVHDTFASVWGSPLVVENRIYLGDEDGDIVILRAGRTEEVLAEMNMGGPVYGSPVPANGTLFIATYNQLYALAL
jgi:outer membrane protein assembly factor BamB